MESTSLQPVSKFKKTIKHIKRDRQLLIILLPCIIFYAIFRYGPMFGIEGSSKAHG